MKRGLVVLGIVAALVAVVYLTKPGGTSSRRGSSSPAADDDVDPAERIVYWSPSMDGGVDGGPDAGPATTGSRRGSMERRLHGSADVVRGKDAKEEPYRKVVRERFAADWKNPIELLFRDLKALRREFRKSGDFSEETVRRFSGAAVTVSGAVMPIDPIPKNSRMQRLWVANPVIVMAGCIFCFPPTMGDLVYVDAGKKPYRVDREQLYRSVVRVEAVGRLILGPSRSDDGVEYMFGLELTRIRTE